MDVFLIIDGFNDVIRSIEIVDHVPQDMPRCTESMESVFNTYCASPYTPFNVQIDIQGSPFQKKVFQAMLEIPVGEVRSYKEIAEAIGHPLAYRAVGHACHVNPIPIIVPCHRVVGSGHLGGYAYGVEFKQRLLNHERKA